MCLILWIIGHQVAIWKLLLLSLITTVTELYSGKYDNLVIPAAVLLARRCWAHRKTGVNGFYGKQLYVWGKNKSIKHIILRERAIRVVWLIKKPAGRGGAVVSKAPALCKV